MSKNFNQQQKSNDLFRNAAKYRFKVVPASDVKLQEEVSNSMFAEGYEHYETSNIGGGEVIMRFKK